MDVSVIICTWNNCRRLATTLQALGRCKPPNAGWELILVNSGSDDDTHAVARSFQERLPLHYIYEPHPGLSRARNAGLAASSGKWILFTDDDVTPAEGWLSAYVDAFAERPTGWFLGGPVASDYEGPGPGEELRGLCPPSIVGLDHGPDARELRSHELLIGPNWAAPSADLKAAEGFDLERGLNPASGEVRVGEELQLMAKLRLAGLRGWYVPRARVLHWVPASKCESGFILARLEAGQFEHALRHATELGRGVGVEVADLPAWTYREALRLWWDWGVARLRGRSGLREQAAWRLHRGTMRALRRHRAQLRSDNPGTEA